MTTTPTKGEAVTVTQADRVRAHDLAVQLAKIPGDVRYLDAFLSGKWDEYSIVQELARHREEAVREMVEVLRRLEQANEALCATRSAETYNGMIHRDNAHDALIALDDARRDARALLSQNREGLEKEDGRPSATCSRPSGQAPAHDTFWSKASIGSEDDCWLWQRSLRKGYGHYWNGSKNVAAHRFAVEITHGPIAEGMVVDHTCRNRACVNPAHLRVVTRAVNVHENSDAIAHRKSLQTECVHGHPLSGDNLVMDRGRRRCRTCKNQGLQRLRAEGKAGSVEVDASRFDQAQGGE